MIDNDPIARLQQDWQKAKIEGDANSNICILSTTDGGQTHARVLVLRDIQKQGLLIFTHASSPKWQQLENNSGYEVLLYWPTLELQYRIQGSWKKQLREPLQKAWSNKPYEAKLLDLLYQTHPESSEIPDRKFLEEKVAELKMRYPQSEDMPFPDSARGVWLLPKRIEYYRLSTVDRLHHRYLYEKNQNQWTVKTLCP
ncbi:pyridoxamine 5'-phosphate oxidase family protein [Halieaceae bacterium]|nr:pyridoxamine 5'-phosphate oxidase family protein [Halieaceae bacterium]MDB3856053.1 pyridoxamine 5'-phosphate oxidase family protein [Halieaceae bacterium]